MRRFFSSLRVRLVLLVAIAMLPAFGLAFWTSFDQRRDARENVKADVTQLTQSVSAQEEQVVQAARDLLSRLSVAPQVTGSDLAACREYLRGVFAIEPRFSGFGVADTNGEMYCTSVEPVTQLNVADRAYFQRVMATGEFSLGDYIIARDGEGTPVLGLGYPIFNEQRQLAGVVASGVTLDWLNVLSSSINLPENAALVVIDRNGVVLARQPNPENWVGKTVQDTEIGRTVLSVGQGTAEMTGLDGNKRLFAFAPLLDASPNDAYVFVGLSTDNAYAGINETLQRNLILLGGVTALALLVAWFIGGGLVVRKVQVVLDAARRVMGGDLQARTGLHGAGELDRLGRGFDEMAASLEERQNEQASAEEHLRQSEQRFRTFVEAAPDGIVMVDSTGTIILANEAAEAIFGFGPGELVSASIDRLLPAPLQPGHERLRKSFLAEGHARSMAAGKDLRGRRKDGTEVPVAISLTPLDTPQGKLVAATVTDITERKKAQDELFARSEQLARSNAELEQFAYVASHDLQEPLRMVASYTQLLARRYEGRLDNDADEFINFAVDGANRMQALINDLLTLSRVGTRGAELEAAHVEDVLETALRNLEVALEQSAAIVTHDALPEVLADTGQLVQLFQNLIGNAMKFHGEEPPRVHISARQDGDEWVISVRDNGIGIESQYAERIFVMFQRLHGRGEFPGTGIGLAICKKIVERHGGRIWLESENGRGATFSFTLRAAPAGALVTTAKEAA
ncbi:MAG: ATP-binding protein [Dehalococcoidia bacterium]